MSGEDALKAASAEQRLFSNGSRGTTSSCQGRLDYFCAVVIELCCKSKFKNLGSKTHHLGC